MKEEGNISKIIPHLSEGTSSQAPPAAQEIFPSSPIIPLCSWNECLGGHRWSTTLQTVLCGGCKAPVLAVKKENCPYCNEPVGRMSIRTDHIPSGGGVAARCKREVGGCETTVIDLQRTGWVEVQNKTKFFEEREKDANS
jgi:hypothetical protein